MRISGILSSGKEELDTFLLAPPCLGGRGGGGSRSRSSASAATGGRGVLSPMAGTPVARVPVTAVRARRTGGFYRWWQGPR